MKKQVDKNPKNVSKQMLPQNSKELKKFVWEIIQENHRLQNWSHFYNQENKPLTTAEAAIILKIGKSSVLRHMHANRLTPVYNGEDNTYWFLPSEVELLRQYLEGKEKGESPLLPVVLRF
jgi:hypothetical protein